VWRLWVEDDALSMGTRDRPRRSIRRARRLREHRPRDVTRTSSGLSNRRARRAPDALTTGLICLIATSCSSGTSNALLAVGLSANFTVEGVTGEFVENKPFGSIAATTRTDNGGNPPWPMGWN
jgi:hypothetical protein